MLHATHHTLKRMTLIECRKSLSQEHSSQSSSPSCPNTIRGAKVKDFYVQRYPGAVSWFSPGSFGLRPPLQLKDISNCVCAGKQDAFLSYRFAHISYCVFRFAVKMKNVIANARYSIYSLLFVNTQKDELYFLCVATILICDASFGAEYDVPP